MMRPFHGFDRKAVFSETRRRLPHWTQPGCTYFITWRMADSLPHSLLKEWKAERTTWLALHPQPWDEETQKEYEIRFLRRIERWSDEGYGSCALARPEVREIVAAALHHFNGVRYDLDSFVIMPNHVHVLARPKAMSESEADIPVCPSESDTDILVCEKEDGRQECLPHSLAGILKNWKGFTAREINKLLGRGGTFWMDESFDHAVRSEAQLERFQTYIRLNPAKAGLAKGTFTHWEAK